MLRSDEDISPMVRSIKDNAQIVYASVEEVRRLFDEVADDELSSALDQAQGDVKSGKTTQAYVLIVVNP